MELSKRINNRLIPERQATRNCRQRFRVLAQGLIGFLFCLMSAHLYAQKSVDSFIVGGYVFSQTRCEATAVTDGCGSFLNGFTVKDYKAGNIFFKKNICGEEERDVSFIKKGYLTVLEHYSSPVGWGEYYIFDLRKKRIIRTKHIDKGVKVDWEKFIDMDESFEKQLVEEIISF